MSARPEVRFRVELSCPRPSFRMHNGESTESVAQWHIDRYTADPVRLDPDVLELSLTRRTVRIRTISTVVPPCGGSERDLQDRGACMGAAIDGASRLLLTFFNLAYFDAERLPSPVRVSVAELPPAAQEATA